MVCTNTYIHAKYVQIPPVRILFRISTYKKCTRHVVQLWTQHVQDTDQNTYSTYWSGRIKTLLNGVSTWSVLVHTSTFIRTVHTSTDQILAPFELRVFDLTSTYLYISSTYIRTNIYRYVLYPSWCTYLVHITGTYMYNYTTILNTSRPVRIHMYFVRIYIQIRTDAFIQELKIFVSADESCDDLGERR